jgi:hypothetical protein
LNQFRPTAPVHPLLFGESAGEGAVEIHGVVYAEVEVDVEVAAEFEFGRERDVGVLGAKIGEQAREVATVGEVVGEDWGEVKIEIPFAVDRSIAADSAFEVEGTDAPKPVCVAPSEVKG